MRVRIVRTVSALAVTIALIGLSLSSTAAPVSAQTLNQPTITAPTTTSAGSVNEATPTVTIGGTADANTDLVVLDGNTAVGETTSDGEGNWSVPVMLLDGSHQVTAVEVDSAGDESPASTAIQVNVTSNQLVADGNYSTGAGSSGLADNGDHLYLPPDNSNPSVGTPGYWFPTNECPGPTTGYIEWDNNQNPYVGTYPSYDNTEYDNSYPGAPPGPNPNYVELNSNCVNGVTQTINTVPGAQYTLSFGYAARQTSGYTGCSYNDFNVSWGASGGTPSTVASDLCGNTSNWTTGTYTLTATSTSTVLSFIDQDTNASDTLGGELSTVSVVPTASLAPSNTEWDLAAPISLSGGSGSYSPAQSLDFSGETLWYQFPVVPDEQVTVSLTSASPGEQLAVYSDISQALAAQTTGVTTADLPVIEAEDPGNNSAKFNETPLGNQKFNETPLAQKFNETPLGGQKFNETPYLGTKFNETPYVQAEAESLLGESSPAGAASQSITVNTWNNVGNDSTTANYYVEVFGNNGAFSTGNPFTVTVSTSGSACAGLSYPSSSQIFSGGNLNGAGTNYSTVIVDDSSTMPGVSSIVGGPSNAPTDGTLYNLAQATHGVVVDVGQSTGVQMLAGQAKTDYQCPYAVNLEADAIQSIINSYRTSTTANGGSNIQNVIVVGDDDVIPFFRYADAEAVGPENTYSPPLVSTSEAQAALASNYYLTDDQYGAATELTIDGTIVPVENAAVGRLVETPGEISATISNYLTLANQTIVPKSTLTTGYSFMTGPADSIASTFATGDPTGSNATLISNSWSASNLTTQLTNTPRQLVFLGAHFNASGLEAADGSALWSTQFASTIGANLDDSLVISAGCHSGYTIDPADAVSYGNPPTYTTGLPSWPEAFASAGATLIAGTGYQFGDSNYTADSDQFDVDLAQQLGYGTVSIGSALLNTNYQYLASLDQLNGLNEKSLLEITLYGIPNLKISEPTQSSPPPTSSSILSSGMVTSPLGLVGSGPGSQLSLAEADVDVPTASLTENTVGSATYYSTQQGGVTADPNQAVVPVQTEDVSVPSGALPAPGYVLRGVGFVGGNYTDTSGQTPLTGDPVTDTSEPASPFSSPTYYPEKTTNPNYFGTIETGADTQLGITPIQYVTDPSNPSTAIMRKYSDTQLALFYSNNTNLSAGNSSAALASAPEISGVSVSVNGNQVTVTATVIGDLSAGIQKVWTTYTDPTYTCSSGMACWQSPSQDMTVSSTNPNVYSTTFTTSDPNIAASGDFIVQAANGVGEVSLDDNGGYYFTASTQTAPTLNTYSLTFGSGQASTGTYQGSVNVSATLADVTGSGSVNNVPITFSLGSQQVTVLTGSNGTTPPNTTLPLTGSPGSYTLTATYAGDAEDQAVGTSMPFTIMAPSTSLQLTPVSGTQFTSGGSIQATLMSGGIGVPLKTIIFDVFNSSNALVASGIGVTNSAGLAISDPIDPPVDDIGSGYYVTANFAGDLQYSASSPAEEALPPLYDATQSSLTVSPSPAQFGTALTLTATVSPSGTLTTSGWPTTSGAVVPSGTVTIQEDGKTIGTPTLSLNQSTGADTATLQVTGVTATTHTFTASYAGVALASGGGGLTGSSGSATEVVGFTQTISQTYNGPLTIKAGQAVLITGSVSGPITVNAGGGLEVLGGSVSGPISASAPDGFTLCGAVVSGPVSVSKSPADVYIGGTNGQTTCNPSKISGPVSLSKNTGGVVLAVSNISGPVSVDSNSGSITVIAGNTISGPLSCSGNVPGVTDDGQTNSAPVKSDQCGASGF